MESRTMQFIPEDEILQTAARLIEDEATKDVAEKVEAVTGQKIGRPRVSRVRALEKSQRAAAVLIIKAYTQRHVLEGLTLV